MSKVVRLATRMVVAAALLPAAAPHAVADDHAVARFQGTGKADPIRITNVTHAAAGSAGAIDVRFDIAWDHSWRATWTEPATAADGPLDVESWDAAWVFVKWCEPGADGHSHAMLSARGSDHAAPSGATVEVGLTDDGRRGVGVLLFRPTSGHGPNVWKGVTLRWLHDAPLPAHAEVRVFAVQMVRVPTGAFWAGDGSTVHVAGQCSAGGGDQPLRIADEGAIPLGGEAPTRLNTRDGIGMEKDCADDFNIDRTRRLPDTFPKGHAAFYCMRHEVTQQQYVDFLNTGGFDRQCAATGRGRTPGKADAPAGTLALTPPYDQSPSTTSIRIATSGSAGAPARPAVYETDLPHVACGCLGHHQAAAWAAWAGLRPMTELEFEKACRGPLPPVPDEYAWGTDSIAGARGAAGGYAVRAAGQPDEAFVWTGDHGPDAVRGSALCSWNSPVGGPRRVGLFATPQSDRARSGASYWGILDLSGNVVETVVTLGLPAGRRFRGTHGEGGDAPWAGVGFAQRGGGVPYGSHAGGWGGDAAFRVSNRVLGPTTCTGGEAQWAVGFRGVRTAAQGGTP